MFGFKPKSYLGDELVPADTAVLDGGQNITIPTIEHSLSIYLALSIFFKPIINFLESDT
jgi:hypothetical protein